jgi:adenylate cyclase
MAVSAVVAEVQLVKMIGDAAMFVSPSAPALMETVQELVKCIHAEGKSFPDVRVGVAVGPATTRAGDWFGRPVNLASRVTDLAKPGTVLATEEVQQLTPDLPWKRKRRRRLKGVDGRVRLFELEQPEAAKAEAEAGS